MSFTINLTAKGIKGAVAALKEFEGSVIPDTAEGVLSELGEQMVSEMQGNCPVDTGLLQSEIAVTEVSADKLVVESPTDYAGFVNFGTWKTGAQPYFSNTVDTVEAGGGDLIDNFSRDALSEWNRLISEHKND